MCLLFQLKRRTFSHHLLWTTARLLVTSVSLTFLVEEFFIFLFLVLLKEIRTRGGSQISSCCFCVWCKSKELGGRQGMSNIPLCNPSDGKPLLRLSSSYNRLLVRDAFRILSNIHEGALLQK